MTGRTGAAAGTAAAHAVTAHLEPAAMIIARAVSDGVRPGPAAKGVADGLPASAVPVGSGLLFAATNRASAVKPQRRCRSSN